MTDTTYTPVRAHGRVIGRYRPTRRGFYAVLEPGAQV